MQTFFSIYLMCNFLVDGDMGLPTAKATFFIREREKRDSEGKCLRRALSMSDLHCWQIYSFFKSETYM